MRTCADVVWRPLFSTRFVGLDGVAVTLATENFFHEYCERLTDPHPGDCVEVAWEGTFNLLCDEHVTTYEGRAWWTASIVERQDLLYKIHYPQWDATVWDEWVPRHRIRWPTRPHDTTVRSTSSSPWPFGCPCRCVRGGVFVPPLKVLPTRSCVCVCVSPRALNPVPHLQG